VQIYQNIFHEEAIYHIGCNNTCTGFHVDGNMATGSVVVPAFGAVIYHWGLLPGSKETQHRSELSGVWPSALFNGRASPQNIPVFY
jgi:hypothetical protein